MRKYLGEVGVDTNEWVMCYPYASYNDSTIKKLKAKGCVAALDVVPKTANLDIDNHFALPRLDTNQINGK